MKVIHIAGFSNSGKTTFIRALLPELEKLGTTGVVKHIGHHGITLPEGKDTTLFFAAGSAASAGIDREKAVVILKETDLEHVLGMFCDAGVEYAVVEGFKERPYPKVVIGDIPGATAVLLTDPSVEQVLAHLDEFSELITREGFCKEMERTCAPGRVIQVSALTFKKPLSEEQVTRLSGQIGTAIGGEVSVRLASTTTTGVRTLLSWVCAADERTAFEAATQINSLIRSSMTPYTE